MAHRIYRYLHNVSAPNRTRVEWFDLIEIGLVALGFLLYFIVRASVVDQTGEALENARWIIGMQSDVGVFVEPEVNRWALGSDLLTRLFNFVYFWFDFPLIVAVGLFMFWRSRPHYTLLRDSLLISGGFALILYWTFPVAPPRYLTEWGFVDTLAHFSNLSYQAQSMEAFVNPFAAVPSLHVGWSVLLAVVIWHATHNWMLRVAGVAVLVLQCVAVVATANHYLFDGIAGTIVSLAGLAVALWLQRGGYPRLRQWFHDRAEAERRRTSGRRAGSAFLEIEDEPIYKRVNWPRRIDAEVGPGNGFLTARHPLVEVEVSRATQEIG